MEKKERKSLYSCDLKGKYIYIRHGQTTYNQNSTIHNKKSIKCQKEYIDCALSEKGVEQAKNLSKKLNAIQIEKVFVSPLKRALQTTFYALENHPNIDNIVVTIHPLITETVSGVHDFTFDTDKKKKEFNMETKVKFDWSLYDKIFPTKQDQDFFFFNYVDLLNKKKLEKAKEELYTLDSKENVDQNLIAEKVAHFSKIGVEAGLRRMESLKHMFNRGIEFKKFLLDKKFDSDTDKKVIVITHSAFIKMNTSNEAYSLEVIKDFPADSYKMENCEAISMHIENSV